MLGESDEAQLSFAHDEGRVILTHDDDFLRLHAASRAHAGVIYALQEKPIGDIIHGVMLVYQLLEADEMIDHVEFL